MRFAPADVTDTAAVTAALDVADSLGALRIVDDGLEPLVLAVDVVNLEFDDDGVIIGWASGIFAEQLDGLRVADRQGE